MNLDALSNGTLLAPALADAPVLAPTVVSPRSAAPLRLAANVALVHDYLLVMRGAERTFAAIADCFPESPLYALLYDPDGTGERFAKRGVRTSGLQRLGLGQRGFRALLPLLPAAAGRLHVEGSDVVISSSSAFAHGVCVPETAIHVCYCHSPFRYVWEDLAQALGEAPAPLRPALRAVLAGIRAWDVAASRRVTRYIANSEVTRRRIADHWGRDATVIHPPVDIDRFSIHAPEDYFVTVSELVRHKRVDVALEAAKRAHRPIKVVGTGPDLARLSEAYAGTAEFLGRVSDRELEEVVGHARAFVLPGVEEFGIAAVEAQAAGRPVLAADAGGARETIVAGESGVFVPLDDTDAFAEAMRSVDFEAFDPERIRAGARRFSTANFQRALLGEVERVVAEAGSPAGNLHEVGRPARRPRSRAVAPSRRRDRESAPLPPAQVPPAQVRQRHLVQRVSLVLGDLAAAAAAGLCILVLGGAAPHPVAAFGWPLLLLASLETLGLYTCDSARIAKPGLDEFPGLFQATTISLMALTALGVAGLGAAANVRDVIGLWILTPIMLLVARQIARSGARLIVPVERCLVLGDDAAALRVEGILASSPRVRARVVARVELADARVSATGGAAAHTNGGGSRRGNGRPRPTITAADLPAMVHGLEVHRVIMSARSHRDADRTETMHTLEALGVGISLLPAAFEMGVARLTVERLGGLPVVGCATRKRARAGRALKRAFDIAVAGVALALLAPAFGLIAMVIKLDSAGPALFRQRRVGRGGRHFSILKLRTMVDRADEQRDDLRVLNESRGLFKLTLDPRVTRVGRMLRRTSLDELPQLINVLRGQMSLVGPRPLVPEEDALITGSGRLRLSVVPGITGPWQVLGPLRVPLDEMVQVDYLYVADWSLWGDAKILLRTAAHVLSGGGL